MHLGPVPLRALAVAAALAAFACAGCDSGTDRPAGAAWSPVWVQQRDSIPSLATFVAAGEPGCGRLVAELRKGRELLLPTPTEALDAVVSDWVGHAEAVVFDCPVDDEERLAERLQVLDVLAAEIDAGIAADEAP